MTENERYEREQRAREQGKELVERIAELIPETPMEIEFTANAEPGERFRWQ